MATKPPTTTTAVPPPPTTSISNLTFEKKNTHLLHIPSQNQPSFDGNAKTYRIAKRPIPRTPIASPYAGSHVPKPVYISSKTPFMSAVKRVQKLLRLAERRAMLPLIGGKGKRRQAYHHHQQHGAGRGGDVLEKCQQRLREEKVLVKATGRAIEKAVNVGRWFEEGKGGGGEEYEVVVRTGSVCVVDDIVEEDIEQDKDEEERAEEVEEEEGKGSTDPDITMNMTTTTNSTTNTQQDKEPGKEEQEESKNQRRRRRKRERIREQRLKAFVDEDGETPESRTRWVNMVEIAINMK